MLKSIEVKPGLPRPFPSRFSHLLDEDWTDDDWKVAEDAATTFPSMEDREMLLCACRNHFKSFRGEYKRRWNALPVEGLSPDNYFKICVEKGNTSSYRSEFSNAIHVRSTTMTSLFVGSNIYSTAVTYNNRRIFTDKEQRSMWTMQPLRACIISAMQPNSQPLFPIDVGYEKLYIVSGESGSGKTTFGVMTSELGIYVTPHDIDMSGMGSLSMDDRNKRVVSAVTMAVERILKDFFVDTSDEHRGKDPVTISLVLDEFGQFPAFVQSLCAVQDDVRKCVAALIPFAVKIKMLVIGTGTDLKHEDIVSHPDTYVALRMPNAAPMMAATIKAALVKRYADRSATLVNALECHGQAQHLIGNPRFAACLFKRLVKFCDPNSGVHCPLLFSSVEVALLALDQYLIVSAQDYKDLGAFSDYGKASVAHCYKLALELLLRDVRNTRKLTGEDFCLFARQGVLTDCSQWVPLDLLEKKSHDFVAISGVEHEVKDADGKAVTLVLAAPRTGRYAMSMAQHLLFRMSYGLHVLETAASWQRYEVVVAEYVSALVCGLQGRPLRDLVGRLGTLKSSAKKSSATPVKKKAPKSIKPNIVVAKALDQKLRYDTVTTVHSMKQIEPRTSHNDIEALYEKCLSNEEHAAAQNSAALVVVNAAGTQYANVIVAIPRVAVILIQCQPHVGESALDVSAEAKILDEEICALNTVAHVPNGAYLRVLATPGTLDESTDLGGVYHLDTSNPASLAPLFTPIHAPDLPADDDFKVVCSISIKPTRIGKRK